jgi:hypothetical protein
MGRKNTVGIISTDEHTKGLTRMLADKGYKFELLGGHPKSIPPAFDVVICRVASCSHGAFDLAIAASRGGRNVIFEDGSTRAVEALKQVEAGTFNNAQARADALKGKQPNKQKQKPKAAYRGVPAAVPTLTALVEAGGFYTHRIMQVLTESEALDLYRSMNVNPSVDMDVVKRILADLYSINPKTVGPGVTTLKKKGTFVADSLYNKAGKSVNLLWANDLDVQAFHKVVLADATGYFASSKAAAKAREEDKAKAKAKPVKVMQVGWIAPEKLDPAGDICAKDTLKSEPNPKTVKSDAEELDEMLFFLREQLDKMGLQKTEGHGVAVQMQTVHLTGPEGFVCGKRGVAGVGSRKPGEVSCKKCLNTKAYALATFWAQ